MEDFLFASFGSKGEEKISICIVQFHKQRYAQRFAVSSEQAFIHGR